MKVFSAQGLLSKFGFWDGDMLDDFLWGVDLYDALPDDDYGVKHRLIVAVVKQHLLPLLNPGIEVDVFCTCHNPIRATMETMDLVDDDVTVDVDDETLVQLTHAVIKAAKEGERP